VILADDVGKEVVAVLSKNDGVSAVEEDGATDELTTFVSVFNSREGAGKLPRGGNDDIASRLSVNDGVAVAVNEAGVVAFRAISGCRTALLETESEDISNQTALTRLRPAGSSEEAW